MRAMIRGIAAALATATLAACGGGVGGGGGGENPPLQTVVFTRLGVGQADLVAVAEDGTNARVLARSDSLPLDFQAFSSDLVIFSAPASGGLNLFSVRAEGGAAVPLTNGSFDHRFAAVGSSGRVIYTRISGRQSDIYSVNADGSDPRDLATATDSNEQFFAVSPGGRVIYIKRPTSPGAAGDLWSVGDDGSNPIQLTNTAYDDAPLFVAADERIVNQGFDPSIARYVVTSTKTDGTGAVNLLVSNDRQAVHGKTLDGRVILRRVDGTGSQFDLYTVRADGTDLVTLADSTDSENFRLLTPSGRVVFTRDKPGQPGELLAVNADGSGLKALGALPNNGQVVGATPNGYVILSGLDQAGVASLFTVPEDERAPMIAVAAEGGFFAGRFGGGSTSDGRIVYSRFTSSGRLDVYSVKADGSEASVLLAGASDNESLLGITPQGRVIIQRATDGGAQTDLFSVRADGSGFVSLADTPADEGFGGVF